jgi:tRNA(fMet)-specific endonuclease VapC
VAGELQFGFRSGSRYAHNLKTLEAFLANPYVELLPVTWTTAERFGRIAVALRAKGRPIPTNDIWIAAHAMETGADLLSFDEHYSLVDGIARPTGPDQRPPTHRRPRRSCGARFHCAIYHLLRRLQSAAGLALRMETNVTGVDVHRATRAEWNSGSWCGVIAVASNQQTAGLRTGVES